MAWGARGDALDAARRIGEQVAGPAAGEVDRGGRFPAEAVEALRAQGLLAAGVPAAYGGLGCDLPQLVDIAQVLAQHCASTAMIWAMHQIQVACIARHGTPSPYFEASLREVAGQQLLIASITSEAGTGGDTRTSIAAVERQGEQGETCRLEKAGTTVSYGAYADGFLVTARRALDAPGSDQVLVLLRRAQTTLEQTGEWDTLGMRGTCSPGFRVAATFAPEQILPVPFAGICAQTMVPFAHILWSACWLGIATDAVRRARRFGRGAGRLSAGQAAPVHVRLAEAATLLQGMRAHVSHCAGRYQTLLDAGDGALETLAGFGFAVEMNQLKVAASEQVVAIVARALGICGMAGYRASGPYSVERHLRDAYSAACMIGNDRLHAANAAMLLLQKET
jgi:acyl-CoA dehydrogenase